MELNILIKRMLFLTFIYLLLLQNSIALLIVSFIDIKPDFIFISKELYIVTLLLVLIIIKKKYLISKIDKIIILIISYLIVVAIGSYHGITSTIYGLRYYIVPFSLLFLGKFFFNELTEDDYNKTLTIAIILLLFLSIFYVVVDKYTLLGLNISKVFEAKGKIVAGTGFYKDFPLNFFSFYGEKVYRRLVGPFFDPLAIGFFLVPLLFYCRYEVSPKYNITNHIFYLSLIVLLIFSQTRAIILSFMLTTLVIKKSNQGKFVINNNLLIILVAFIIAIVIVIIFSSIGELDPSSRAHLSSYYNFINHMRHITLREFLIGQGFPEDLNFGSESIFLSMIIHNGFIFFILFNYFVYSVYRHITINMNNTIRLNAASSLIAYYLASFTTEHWFAITSSGIFWIILGISLSDNKNYEGVPV